MPPPISLIWFRDDLRVTDHPALAATAGHRILCLYVLDESPRPLGGAARWWLAGALRALASSLAARGATLVLRRGAAAEVIPALVRQHGVTAAFWNRRYDPAAAAIDAAIEAALTVSGVAVRTFQANLLAEPGRTKTRAGGAFAVFTPFWRHMLAQGEPRVPLPAPARIEGVTGVASDDLQTWHLEPQAPDWAAGLRAAWTRGERAARERLESFVADTLAGYAARRDRPDLDHTSRLSPHLRFGEISPFQVWHAARLAREAPPGTAPGSDDVARFLTELGWREFSWHLLHHHGDLATRNVQRKFDAFPWRRDAQALRAWQRGRTGYPIVDAGMRQLWQTGTMHNRVRMIVASFLAKHLLIDWREGERWFWDTLVDADPASNPANWQWVAGCGADAAPYFRIFNPLLQGEKFDPEGAYVRRFVPELAALPNDIIHAPFAAPPARLVSAGVRLGVTYPAPIVEHKPARERALAAFARVKGAS